MPPRRRCTNPDHSRRPAPHPGPRCSTCWKAETARRREAAWERHIEATYGITAEQYWAIYEAQGGRCAICRRATGRTRRLAVDHCHRTGEVRGLLDKSCNRMLGHLRDEPKGFERAANYLRNPPARGVLGCPLLST